MKKKTIIIAISIIALVFLTVGVSFAYWFTTNTQTNSNIVTSSCLKLSFNGENDINITDGYPMTNGEGKKLNPYTFTLTNECTEQTAYTINLETVSKGAKILKDEYIKANLQQNGKDLFLNKLTEEHVNEEKIIKDASKAYKLYSGTIEPKGSEGATQTFDLRLWMDEGVTLEQEDAMNATYEGKITIGARLGEGHLTISNNYNALADLVEKKEGQLIYDKTVDNNLRFVGANPDNYVTFNNETWRIIGVMNNIEDENGVIGSHLKIIRDSIGGYSWDSSSHDINSGYGVNEWSTSAIAKVLNENFYNKKVGGKCYNTQDLRETKCPDWESIGLNDEARSMVSKVKWNTGTMPVKYDENNNSNLITPTYMYNAEKSKNIGNICNNETYCNDKVKRTTLWTGYVGLMYPSDYGYATNGGGESQRQDCLNISMSSWHLENNKTNCVDNNWLKLQDGFQWTITPATSSTYSCESFALRYEGCMGVGTVRSGNGVKPVVYLNSNVKIEPNDDINYGSIDKPFKLINE